MPHDIPGGAGNFSCPQLRAAFLTGCYLWPQGPPCLRRSTWPGPGWWGHRVWALDFSWVSRKDPPTARAPHRIGRGPGKEELHLLFCELDGYQGSKPSEVQLRIRWAHQEHRGGVGGWGRALGSRRSLLARFWGLGRAGRGLEPPRRLSGAFLSTGHTRCWPRAVAEVSR